MPKPRPMWYADTKKGFVKITPDKDCLPADAWHVYFVPDWPGLTPAAYRAITNLEAKGQTFCIEDETGILYETEAHRA